MIPVTIPKIGDRDFFGGQVLFPKRAMHPIFTFICAMFFLFPVASVLSQETDHYVGTFSSAETGLSLSCAKTGSGYEGYLALDGKKYPFTGVKFLGMVSGTYAYEGQEVAFTLARIMGIYYVTSDGVSIEVARTSEKPGAAVAAAKPKPPVNSQQPAPVTPATAPPASVAAANGASFSDPYGSYTFRAPAGWAAKAEGGGFTLSKTGSAIGLAVTPHAYNSVAEIRNEVFDIQDDESQTYLKASVQTYGSNGLLVRYAGSSQGKKVVIETVSLVSPHGGGVNVTGSGEAGQFTATITQTIQSVAAGVTFTKAPVSAAGEQWRQRLMGKELLFLQTEGGGSTKISIHLCRNGSFTFYSNDSYTSGGFSDFSYAGQDNGSGSWRIVSKSGQPVLMLTFKNGSVNEYTLTTRSASNEVGLNGRRYFVQGSNTCP